jgi:hypothetical protein
MVVNNPTINQHFFFIHTFTSINPQKTTTPPIRKNLIWLVVEPTPLKNDGRIVSWDDLLFPTEWTVIKIHGSKAPTSYTWND